jgi:S-adenosylmethionine:tRNA ribosyltransferase-isomerase
VTLHVGLGTFQPVRPDGRLHAERYEVTPENEAKIRAASRRVAVGTTSVRTLETLARDGAHGETDLFIKPGFEFLLTGAMLTNFHLPGTSLLMLVSAFAGLDFTRAAYEHAVAERYRFYSYGDCMLIV